MRHPADPKHAHDAASELGATIAEGRCSLAHARIACAAIAEFSDARVDKSGLRARLCWTAMDSANAHAQAIWRAEDGLRQDVRPMIDARAAKAAIEEAAGKYADILGWPRMFGILREEVARSRHKARWR